MSKTTTEPKEFKIDSKDIYSVYNHNVERFFDEVEKSIPKYHQSITNLQQACITLWKNATESAISIQRDFATKVGTNTNVSPSMAKIVHDVSEEMFNAQSVQNKAILATIEATEQGINTFYENTKSFNWLNQDALKNWISACTPTRN
jgi:SMC interacting uncharacterized protein involved in chromosome segregation